MCLRCREPLRANIEGDYRAPGTKTGTTIDPKLGAVSDSPIVPAPVDWIHFHDALIDDDWLDWCVKWE